MTADGSVGAPFPNIATALSNPKLKAQHTIILLDGRHTLANPTVTAFASGIIKAQNPLRATLDLTGAQVADGYGDGTTAGNPLTFRGALVRVEDLYITCYPLTRVTPARFTYPMGMGALRIEAPSPPAEGAISSIKRCVVSDIIHVACYAQNTGGVVTEDSILYDFGWNATETGDGEYIYTQNVSASPLKVFRRCLFGRTYGLAVQLYSESSPKNFHYLFEDITTLGEFYALAGEARNDVTYRRILAWKSQLSLGYMTETNSDCSIIDCYSAGHYMGMFGRGDRLTITGNTVVKVDNFGEMWVDLANDDTVIDGNHYYGNVSLRYNGQYLTWAQWQALGFDANGSYSADPPASNAVFVVPSDGAGYVLGQVTIYNWEETDTVTLDLDALGVTNGQSVVLRSIDDPMGDARTLTVISTSVIVDMTTRTVSVPHGAADSLTPALDVRFGAWRVELST